MICDSGWLHRMLLFWWELMGVRQLTTVNLTLSPCSVKSAGSKGLPSPFDFLTLNGGEESRVTFGALELILQTHPLVDDQRGQVLPLSPQEKTSGASVTF